MENNEFKFEAHAAKTHAKLNRNTTVEDIELCYQSEGLETPISGDHLHPRGARVADFREEKSNEDGTKTTILYYT